MPNQLPKQTYPAASAVTILVVLMGLFGREIRPMIPPAGTNDLRTESSEFLISGSQQSVKWTTLDYDPLATARRLDKPIMLMIGSPGSSATRFADKYWFRDRDLTDMVNSYTVPVRVDASTYPQLQSLFLSVARSRIGFDPLFQIWFISPRGKLINGVYITNSFRAPSASWMMTRIRTIAREDRAKWSGEDTEDKNATDRELLEQDILEQPGFDQHLAFLRSSIDPRFGGLVSQNRQVVRPFAWQYLWLLGSREELEASLRPALQSSLVDWLDGGFFRYTNTPNFAQIEVDKMARANADMVLTLGLLHSDDSSSPALEIARDAFDFLTDKMWQGESMAAYQRGDANVVGRSPRYSVSVVELRNSFEPAMREWSRQHLGLVYEVNPQMLLRAKDISKPFSQEGQKLLKELRRLKGPTKPEKFGGKGQLNVTAYCLARMMEFARFTRDPVRAKKVLDMAPAVDRFRIGDTLIHSDDGRSRTDGTLNDYLSYSEFCYQRYCLTGRLDYLERGLWALRRALFLFSTDTVGLYTEGRWPFQGSKFAVSEGLSITDEFGQSSASMAIRLTRRYGAAQRLVVLPSPTQSEESRSLLTISGEISSRIGAAINQAQDRVSSAFTESYLTQNSEAIYVYGPNAGYEAGNLRHQSRLHDAIPVYPGLTLKTSLPGPGRYRLLSGGKVAPLAPAGE
jgi:uncharacterized protein YyaL (SSP411 family)